MDVFIPRKSVRVHTTNLVVIIISFYVGVSLGGDAVIFLYPNKMIDENPRSLWTLSCEIKKVSDKVDKLTDLLKNIQIQNSPCLCNGECQDCNKK